MMRFPGQADECPACHLTLDLFHGVLGCRYCRQTVYYLPIDARGDNKRRADEFEARNGRPWQPRPTQGAAEVSR